MSRLAWVLVSLYIALCFAFMVGGFILARYAPAKLPLAPIETPAAPIDDDSLWDLERC